MALEAFFKENPVVALGLSGGAGSSYLLYAGILYGAKIKPYFAKTAFQPEFELRDAFLLAKQVEADLTVLGNDILSNRQITAALSKRTEITRVIKPYFSAVLLDLEGR